MEIGALPILRRNLSAFISADPVSIVLTRSTQVKTLAGGTTKGMPVSLPPQQFRLVPFKRRLSNEIQNTQDGNLKLASYVLVGRYNVDVQRGDEFDHNGESYTVVDIEPKTNDRLNTDRVSCSLEIRG